MNIRIINDYVSQCGNRYFFYWQGDEVLMKATNDAEAVEEGKQLEAEFSQEV